MKKKIPKNEIQKFRLLTKEVIDSLQAKKDDIEDQDWSKVKGGGV